MCVAVNRHAASLSRPTKAVPALGKLFIDDVGADLAMKRTLIGERDGGSPP
jgi:hypothetical protein